MCTAQAFGKSLDEAIVHFPGKLYLSCIIFLRPSFTSIIFLFLSKPLRKIFIGNCFEVYPMLTDKFSIVLRYFILFLFKVMYLLWEREKEGVRAEGGGTESKGV